MQGFEAFEHRNGVHTIMVIPPEINRLVKNAGERGLYAQVKIVTQDKVPMNIEPGYYLVFGTDSQKVDEMTDEYADSMDFPEAVIAQRNSNYLYLKCSVLRIPDPSFQSMAIAVEMLMKMELIQELLRRQKLPLPERVDNRDIHVIFRIYLRSLEKGADKSAKAELDYCLKVLASGKTYEQYEKENGKNSVYRRMFGWKTARKLEKSAEKVASQTITFKPGKHIKNYVSHEDMSNHLGVKKTISVSHNAIAKVAEYLGNYADSVLFDNLQWTLVETVPIVPYGTDRYVYWHPLTYPAEYEALVCGIVNRVEYGLERVLKPYTKGLEEHITAVAIPVQYFQHFRELAANSGLEYYYDVNSTYVKQTAEAIGICVEDSMNKDVLMSILNGMLMALEADSFMRDDPVYLERKAAQRKVQNALRENELRIKASLEE